MKHELKIWPQYYCRVKDGSKTFEVRDNDRGFQTGDDVVLREWDPAIEEYDTYVGWATRAIGFTNSEPLKFKIGYVHPIEETRVVFSLLASQEGASE
jgi:hypothetical protein